MGDEDELVEEFEKDFERSKRKIRRACCFGILGKAVGEEGYKDGGGDSGEVMSVER